MQFKTTHLLPALKLALFIGFSGILAAPAAQAQTYPLTENSWDNPEFVKRFLGSYGMQTRLEPELSREEGELFRELVEIIPNNPQEAIRRLRTARTRESSAALDFLLASLQLQERQPDEAIRNYEEAIRKFPNFLRAYRNLGLALTQAGRYQDAIPHLVKAIELGDGDGNSYGLLAYCYLNVDRPRSALDAYRIAYVLRPENRDWKIGLAQALNLTGENEQAAAVLSELIEADPSNPTFWLTRANALLAKGESEDAATHLEMVRRMGRANSATHRLLGDIYLSQGVNRLARDSYLRAMESRDDRVAAPAAIRVVENLVAYGLYDEALDVAARLESDYELTDAQEVEVLNLRAEIALAKGEDAEAARILEEVVAVEPLNGSALLLLADYHARQDDFEEATFFFERARSLDDYRPDALVQQARMEVRRRNYGDAVRLLQEAQSIRPRTNVENYLNAVRNAFESTR
ncbi:MAG: tetratricopeptide repeat protein [Opitutales bacterium]|nr:tetratricopeptide repeat protein [Opitutales bacterium]